MVSKNLLDLPPELLTRIFSLLDSLDLLRLHASSPVLNVFLSLCSFQLRTFDGVRVWLVVSQTERRFMCLHDGSQKNLTDTRPYESVFRGGTAEQFMVCGQHFDFYRLHDMYGVPSLIFRSANAKTNWLETLALLRVLLHLIALLYQPTWIATNVHSFQLAAIAQNLPKTLRGLDLIHQSRRTTVNRKHKEQHIGLSLFEERDVIATLRLAPQLTSVNLDSHFSVSSNFYLESCVQRLRSFSSPYDDHLTDQPLNFNDAALNSEQKWLRANIGQSQITPKGVKQFVVDWAVGQREMRCITLEFTEKNKPKLDELLEGVEATVLSRMGARWALLERKDRRSLEILLLKILDDENHNRVSYGIRMCSGI